MVDGKVRVPDKETVLPLKDYVDIDSTIQYLIDKHGVESLHGMFGRMFKTEWKQLSRWGADDEIMAGLKLTRGGGVEEEPAGYSLYLDKNNVLPVEGFKRVSWFESPGYYKWDETKRNYGDLFFGVDNGSLKFADSANATPQSVPRLDEFIAAVPDKSQAPAPMGQMTVDFEYNGRALRIIFIGLTLQRKPGGHPVINVCSLLLLEK